jgi:hypothetical protein
MSISFACACGKNFTVADEYAGKRTKCPACGAPLTVPAPAGEPAPQKSESEEDAAYRALLEAPEADTASPNRAAPPASHFDQPPPPPARPTGPPTPTARKPKFRKPSAEEREARKHREPRQHDPERGKRTFYVIGGVFLMLLGAGIGFISVNERISIRGGVAGFFMVIGGIRTFFQGVSGNFDDE